ncbi:MAG: efflux RND transporter periplasmic adaptor subunit [Burkholderiales bacterium]|nr:efflux RND transporter periplasmic adaptor subunit [Burkholderiales bacterium]
MNKVTKAAVSAIVLVLVAGLGYYSGRMRAKPQDHAGNFQNVMGNSLGDADRKPIYYRNPMGLPDTSPVPKKDPMGMDYVPVFLGDQDTPAASAGQIKISTEKVQKLGVRTETAQLRAVKRIVRAAGRIEPDERRLFTIAPKFEGYVEHLNVNITGQQVGRGQVLFEAYSPELVAAQREYVIAAHGMRALKEADAQNQLSMKQLADSSLTRLKNWDVSDEQIKALSTTGETKRTLTFRSPVSGVVMEKRAVQGMRFMPGEMLYQVADLSKVWVIADVFEQDIGSVKLGSKATVQINAYPGMSFIGTVTYIYPTLKAETRTVPVRIELANSGFQLKPSMFAEVELSTASNSKVVSVPLSSVIDSGTRQIVLVQLSEGRFEPREVKLGLRNSNHVEVLDGIKNGESVVVAANFLIDAESNLKAAVGGFSIPGTKTLGHQAEGVVEEIDAKDGTVSIKHGAVASLKWPPMTMQFKVANDALVKDLKVGAPVSIEFIERNPGEWVITRMNPDAGSAAVAPSAAPAGAHAGH